MVAAMATEDRVLSYRDVERLCERHLAHRSRIDIAGPRIARYEPCEIQRFRPAFPHVSALLLERVDFDRAFRRLDKRHQQVLIAWYGFPSISIDKLAEEWGVHRATVIRRKHRAVHALRDILTNATVKG